MHTRHDLTDEQWALIEPHLPPNVAGVAGRPWADHRQVVNGVLWRTRAGCTWRDVPTDYGPWKTVYNRHRRWSADGTWDALLGELQRGSDTQFDSWDVGIDSTVVRAHQDAAGAPRTLPSDVVAGRLAVALEQTQSGEVGPAPHHTGGHIELQEVPGSRA
ncbi:MAG: IS5 family transposase [Nocardioidaceae bacterium]|nr:IS5 family transposase [Nocardioidaceae bacterium]